MDKNSRSKKGLPKSSRFLHKIDMTGLSRFWPHFVSKKDKLVFLYKICRHRPLRLSRGHLSIFPLNFLSSTGELFLVLWSLRQVLFGQAGWVTHRLSSPVKTSPASKGHSAHFVNNCWALGWKTSTNSRLSCFVLFSVACEPVQFKNFIFWTFFSRDKKTNKYGRTKEWNT